MSQMKELYEKVSVDENLKKEFYAILGDAEKAGQEATEEKLTAFAKDAGYAITEEEMLAFFGDLKKQNDGELSDLELDMVAGGKSEMYKALNIATLGTFALTSLLNPDFDCANVTIPHK
jgi:predicted ribosomally synthesized peptide with nif11-like leader